MSGWSWKLLRAGAFKLDAGAMFGLVPKPLWSRLVEPDERNRMPLNTNCLLLERDGHIALIETGIGDKSSDKQRDIFAIERRSILDALHEADCDPKDISTVLVTHLHFDHAGGLTRLPHPGEQAHADTGAVSTFPNAEIVVQRQEWEDALANKSTMHSTYLREHLAPIEEQVRVVEGAEEPLLGVEVRTLPGHTWGQQGVFIEDERGRTVVFCGDLMPTRHHAGLTYNMAYDMLPYENMLQKRAFLDEAVRDGWLIVLDHEPDEPIVRVQEGEKAHRLVPTEA